MSQSALFTTILTHPGMSKWKIRGLYQHGFIAHTLYINIRDLIDTFMIQEFTFFLVYEWSINEHHSLQHIKIRKNSNNIHKYIFHKYIKFLYPECPHRQGGCLAWWRWQSCKIDSRLWLSWIHQSIWSTVSDAIVRRWLWSTVTRNSPLGYFSNNCK